jgi:hypothetical protein
MIRCTLEIIPGGIGEPRQLGIIEIWNDLKDSLETEGARGSYRYELQKKIRGRVAARGEVRGYPRQAYSVWELVRRVLADVKIQGRL